MSVRFDAAGLPPLRNLSLSFADGTIAGLIGGEDAGATRLLELAAGRAQPEQGSVEATPERALVEASPRARQELRAAIAVAPKTLAIDHALALLDAVAQAECIRQLNELRRRGGVVLIASHDLALVERICDVAILLEAGEVVEQGDPGLVVAHYRRRAVERIRSAAAPAGIEPSWRRGDGRAEVCAIDILGEDGRPTATVRSGEPITVAVKLRFREAVANPVAGLLIRNRVGVSVYGTNTELEQTAIGARRAGESAEVLFQFRCDLCPQEYTITVASHDPDGTAHDWMEEAVLFSVIDERYTAGVANLRARVTVR